MNRSTKRASPASAPEASAPVCMPQQSQGVSNASEAALACVPETSSTPWLDQLSGPERPAPVQVPASGEQSADSEMRPLSQYLPTSETEGPATSEQAAAANLEMRPLSELLSTIESDGTDVAELMSSPVLQEASTEAEAKQYVIQLLVGGSYTDANGKEHPFGHTAVRLVDGENSRDMIYDFGRYGRTNGDFSAEGEGILRKWDGAYDEYIDNQNATGRETRGYSFPVTEEQYNAAVAYAESLQENSLSYSGSTQFDDDSRRDVVKLEDDYHGLNNNCTTLAVDIAEAGMPDTDFDVSGENDGTGLSTMLKLAARASGWPEDIFMPADLGSVLDGMATDNPGMVVDHWDPSSETPHRQVQPSASASGG